MRAGLTLALIGITTAAHAEQFLWAPLDTLTLNCDFCCYYGPGGGCHGAIDYRASQPRPVFTTADGVVERVVNTYADQPTSEWTYGNRVDIRHPNGYLTRYAHLTRDSITVRNGSRVVAGQQIALSDNSGRSTGPHLHFEVRDPSGQKVNPYGDPPDYEGGCGPDALWATCPPVPWEPAFADSDEDGYTVSDGDCDDEDPEINPSALDRCDGVDNDCSGAPDEAFVETGLFTRCSIGIGGCRTSGTWICASEGDGLFCTAPPAGIPRPEVCDGQDNDCNGEVDDGDAAASCDNGIFCDGEEVCTAGRCELGEPVVCNDGVDCTIDLCFEPTRACSTVAAHGRCDDGVECTEDRCGPRGCAHQADHSICDDLDPCTDDWCTASRCVHPFSPDVDADRDGFYAASCAGGTDCNDGNSAINPDADETCDGVDNDCDEVVDDGVLNACGACGPVPTEICNGLDDDCDGIADIGEICIAPSPRVCVDGETLRTYVGVGTCESGICQYGHTDTVCDDSNICTNDLCDPAVGCINELNAASCDDADPCTVNDTCSNGVCTGSSLVCDSPPAECYVPTGECIAGTCSYTFYASSPSARMASVAAWTGSEMIVWGGDDGSSADLDTGGRYNPATDFWLSTTVTGTPPGRFYHTAVWTGSEMIVWGGRNVSGTYLTNGARYDPEADTWTPVTTSGAPSNRLFHTAVWTGSEMIVWGGRSASSVYQASGRRYDPVLDAWMPTTTSGAPSGRWLHTAVWTRSEMIVWGGSDGTGFISTGGRYNPVNDTWSITSTSGRPSARHAHTAIWTGSEMVVWGGTDATAFVVATGGRYNPSTNSWVATSTDGAPSPRWRHTVIWSGSEMVIWGGNDGSFDFASGSRYSPGTDSWAATSLLDAPYRRSYHTAVWTGSEMIVWGGVNPATGGRYDPDSDVWVATAVGEMPCDDGDPCTESDICVEGLCSGTPAECVTPP